MAVLAIVYTIEWLAAPPPDSLNRATASLGTLPRGAIVAVEAGTFVLLIALLERALGNPFIRRLLTAIVAIAVLFIAWAGWSGVSIGNIVVGLRQYLRPVPIALAGYLIGATDPHRVWLRRLLIALGAVAVAQIPLTVYQAVFLTGRAVAGQTAQDVVSGTFGPIASGTLGLFLLSAAGFVLSTDIVRGKVGARTWMKVGLLLLPAVLGGVRAMFPLLAGLVVVSLLFMPGRVTARQRLAVGGGLLCIGVAGASIYGRYADAGFIERFGVDYVRRHFTVVEDGQRLSRGAALVYSASVISDDPSSVLLGKGVGSATRSFFLAPQPPYYHFETDRSLLNRVLIEGGLVGTLLLIGAVWRVNRIGHRAWHLSDEKDVRAAALGVVLSTWVALASIIYNDAMTRSQFSYPFWLLGAYMLAVTHGAKGGDEAPRQRASLSKAGHESIG